MMRVWHGLESISQPFEAVTVAIGMFDGLHVGHQSLIRAAVENARSNGRPAVVFTFDRHPAELIAPDRVPGYLSTPRQRDALLQDLGVDDVVVARFDERFRTLSPEAFLHFVLYGVIGAKDVFVGEDFHFGRNQSGDVSFLRESQGRYGFTLHVHPPVVVNSERASSTRIRALLREGDLDGATEMLGHRYVLSGCVAHGQKLGRKLGFPTANLALTRAQVIPADGIYAVCGTVLGERHMGACSIGMRPTVGGTERTVETYLLDFDGDLYDREMDIEFVSRLRDELKFESLDALVEQMGYDVRQARGILAA
jgi:riboflavin kinase/FMN adenylyltransferase